MIIYGEGEGRTELGEAGTHTCPYCEETADFTVVLYYRFSHIWYVLRILREREYFLHCSYCGGLKPLDKKVAKRQFPKDGIPFLTKYSLLICLGLFVALTLAAITVPAYRTWSQERRFASPTPGDVYLADLRAIPGSGVNASTMPGRAAYGALKLMEIKGDSLVLAPSMRTFPETGLLREALGSDKFPGYFEKSPITMRLEQFQRLHRAEVIFEARR